MRKAILSFSLVMVLVLTSGCSSGERRRVSRETNSLTAAYVIKMDKGETTADQDKRFIKAMSTTAYQIDRSIRGEKKAKQTRLEAERLASIGADPAAPVDLDN